jgi:nitroreductase
MALPEAAMSFLSAMEDRWACKLFDGRALAAEEEDYLLDCGRLSPSSFGLEPWSFVANRPGGPIREALFQACFAQEGVRTAGLVVAILVRRAGAYDPDGPFVLQRSARFPGGHPVFRADFIGYHDYLKASGRLEEWAKAQAYIACANMMTGAAAAGIDSCAIEGYKEDDVLSALGASPSCWRVGIVLVFGRPAEPRREKIREGLSEVSEFR